MSYAPKILDGIILAPRYLGSVEYFAAIAASRRAVIDTSLSFDKRRKETHRCEIADTHGPVRLTVPIEKPVSMTAARWSDIVISAHDAWWHRHWVTLQSAYGRTPFFEFYADDFAPLFTAAAAGRQLTQWIEDLDRLLLKYLQIDTEVTYGAPGEFTGTDCRRKSLPEIRPVPYYQVRESKFGFLSGMSAVDLLFNMGPEAALVLDETVRAYAESGAARECRDGSCGAGA